MERVPKPPFPCNQVDFLDTFLYIFYPLLRGPNASLQTSSTLQNSFSFYCLACQEWSSRSNQAATVSKHVDFLGTYKFESNTVIRTVFFMKLQRSSLYPLSAQLLQEQPSSSKRKRHGACCLCSQETAWVIVSSETCFVSSILQLIFIYLAYYKKQSIEVFTQMRSSWVGKWWLQWLGLRRHVPPCQKNLHFKKHLGFQHQGNYSWPTKPVLESMKSQKF